MEMIYIICQIIGVLAVIYVMAHYIDEWIQWNAEAKRILKRDEYQKILLEIELYKGKLLRETTFRLVNLSSNVTPTQYKKIYRDIVERVIVHRRFELWKAQKNF